MRCRSAISGAVAALYLTACATGPNYVAPLAPTPEHWAESRVAVAAASQVTAQPLASTGWWQMFHDEELSALITRALASNYSVQDALLRIEAARAARAVTAADRWPALSISGLFSRQRVSDKTAVGTLLTGIGNGPGFPLPGLANPFNQFQLGFDASWEVDLFGRVRRSVEAADADTQFAVEDGRDALVTLIGDVTRAYLELRGEQQRLLISERNLASQREVLELTRDRRAVGIGNDLDVANAAAQVSTTEALIPDLERQIDQSVHQLTLLVSIDPSALQQELEAPGDVPPPPAMVPIGLPADLLRRRPDIRRAEAALHAATARVGAAEADLFPRLTLNASVGYQAERAGDLTAWASRFVSLSPQLDLPIFDGGRRRATVRVQTVAERRAALAYAHTVLNAVTEAEDALTAFATEQSRRTALEQAVTASRDALALSRLRYESGVINFLNVLDAERNLQQAELALSDSATTVSTDLVALYKALGGGWQTVTDMAPPRS